MTGVLPDALKNVDASELPVWFGRETSSTTPDPDAPVDIDDRGNTDDDFHGCDDCNDIEDDIADAAEDAAEDIAEILGATERMTDTDGVAGRLRAEALTDRRRSSAADLLSRRRRAIAKH